MNLVSDPKMAGTFVKCNWGILCKTYTIPKLWTLLGKCHHRANESNHATCGKPSGSLKQEMSTLALVTLVDATPEKS